LTGNGGGVYTDENGFAGIGPKQFMITHFINGSTDVTFEGRYLYDPTVPLWAPGSGQVTGAHYEGLWYSVEAISESFTTPTFHLSHNGVPRDVSGPDIVTTATSSFVLHVSLNDGTGEYDLQFNGYAQENGNNVVVRKANMRWRKQGVGWTQYCRMADGTPDPIVFQQGIGVHPLNADLLYNSAYVTPGCRHGGPATVRLWGYTYRINTPTADLFKAALHMKRASYCGDRTFYTESGTQISIWDAAGVNQDPVTPMEASWGPNGATCVDLQSVRRPDVEYPPNIGQYFSGTCADGRVIPPCSAKGSLASAAGAPSP
jgi:hypothetical protein